MKECIYRDDALKTICKNCDKQHPDDKELCPNKFAGCMTYYDVFDIPAANVQPVVYCKDCTVPHNKWTGCPKLGGLVTEPDFFCAFGEPNKTQI